jgi:hypothetical protein
VPSAVQVQFARLFGDHSKLAQATERSDEEWRRDLKCVLIELENYIQENVITESSHLRMIMTGICAARIALDDSDFWPGYSEGITRVALCLLGNYPDHRKRTGGSKKTAHYELRFTRTLVYSKTRLQMLRLLTFEVPAMGIALSVDPFEALRSFEMRWDITSPKSAS